MSVPPAVRKVSEAALQKVVIEFATLQGFKVGHFHDSRRQVRPGFFVGDRDAAGIPDLLLARERTLWIELKAERGRLTPAQKAWIAVLQAAGAEVHVFRPSDWDSGLIARTLARRISASRKLLDDPTQGDAP